MNTHKNGDEPNNMQSPANSSRTRWVIITLLVTALIAAIGVWWIERDDTSFDSSEARNESESQISVDIPRIATDEFFLYVDRQRFRIDPSQETFSRNITEGEHEIILDAPGHWPWSKTIDVGGNETISVSPFLVQRGLDSDVYRFTREPEVYQNLNAQLQAENAETTAVSDDGSVQLDFTASSITATYIGGGDAPDFFCETESSTRPCPTTKTVFEGAPVLDADFYGERNDVFVFGVPAGIYVTEITEKSPQTLQPVYEGELGAMAIIDGSAYLQDQGARDAIIEIPLFQPDQQTTETSTTTDADISDEAVFPAASTE